jgi:hypothetical protein
MFSIFKHKSETFIADKLCAIDYIDFLRVIIVLAALAVEDTLAIAHAVLVGLCPPVSPLPRPGDAHSHNPLHTLKHLPHFIHSPVPICLHGLVLPPLPVLFAEDLPDE